MTSPFSLSELTPILPLLILLLGAVLILSLQTFATEWMKTYALVVTVLLFFVSSASTLFDSQSVHPLISKWIKIDGFSQFFTNFFLFIGLICTLIAYPFFKRFQLSEGEYHFLLLSSIFGFVLIAQSADFLPLFIGLETLSVALYVLCGYMKKWGMSNESSMKYFLMGGVGAALLLYGIALIYGAVGTTQFANLSALYRQLSTPEQSYLFLGGIAFITVGLCFKAAIVPFHVWAPDVYSGAPSPVTALMSVGVKVGAFVALSLIFLITLPGFSESWSRGMSFLAYPTLLYANFVALRQQQLRRFFAYSGISHSGYLLFAFVSPSPDALGALIFYLVVYAIATLAAFAVLSMIDHDEIGPTISDLKGLFSKKPLIATVLILSMLTLAGIPPTIGFFAKLYLFKIAFSGGYYFLIFTGLVVAVLSAYYYLRIAASLFEKESRDEEMTISFISEGTALFLGVLLVILSIYPTPLLKLIERLA